MLIDRIPGDRVEGHKPTPRVVVSSETWRMLAGELAAGRVTLFGLWGDTDKVHMALLEEAEIVVVTVECRDGTFPSVGQVHPPAIRLERAINDLYGLEPLGIPDPRLWLDHGKSKRSRFRRRIYFCWLKARACTRSQSGQCMPALSSPAIFASL